MAAGSLLSARGLEPAGITAPRGLPVVLRRRADHHRWLAGLGAVRPPGSERAGSLAGLPGGPRRIPVTSRGCAP